MSGNETVFSDHVRALAAGEEGDAAVWISIWNVLKAELKRKAIFSAGPAVLGYEGTSWQDDDAQMTLVVDAWRRAIRSRLPRITENLKHTGCVEKLVKRNLRNFIGERQERHDPAGKAIYQNLKRALIHLCEEGVLRRVDAELDEPWSAAIEFSSGTKPDSVSSDPQALQEALSQSGIQFEGLESLLVITERPQKALLQVLQLLAENGCHRYSVRSLIRAIRDLGSASGVVLEKKKEKQFSSFHEEFDGIARTINPDSGFMEEEQQEHVFQKIHDMIDQLPKKDEAKTRLHAVADFFQFTLKEDEGVSSLTVRELADRLGTSKSTLADDQAEVRRIATHVLSCHTPEIIGEHHA